MNSTLSINVWRNKKTVVFRFPQPAGEIKELFGICKYTCLGVILLLALGLMTSHPVQAERRLVKSLLEMRQENVVVQKWDLSCGAAALATLLNYQLGDKIAEDKIAKSLIQRKEYIDKPMLLRIQQGFSLLDLKRFVDKRGYQGIGYGKLKLSDLTKLAPLLVPVNFDGYNHFVVFRGIRGNRVLLADPAWGNRTMKVQQFEEAWLEYPAFGRVGFEVIDPLKGPQPNRLAPRDRDFVMLR